VIKTTFTRLFKCFDLFQIHETKEHTAFEQYFPPPPEVIFPLTDLIPDTLYTVSIELKMNESLDERYWNQPYNLTFHTSTAGKWKHWVL